MKNLIGIGFKFKHHGKFSGYDKILETNIYKKVYRVDRFYNLYFQLAQSSNIVFRLIGKMTFPFFWPVELLVLYLYLKGDLKGSKVHLIYGENMLGIITLLIPKKILITIHQPKNQISSNKLFLKKLKFSKGGIITMDSETCEYLIKQGLKKVKFIPHGVDTSYFSPNHQKFSKEITILQLGNWLRDFELSKNLISEVVSNVNKVIFKILCRSKYHYHYHDLIAKSNQVSLLKELNDFEYLDLLLDTNLLFLPLKDFSANNAILEALSCNINVLIITDKKTEIDKNSYLQYVNIIAPKHPNFIHLIKTLTESKNNSREFILKNYDWKVIGKQTSEFAMNE